MSEGHSILAPSGAATWARCAGSLYLAKDVPEVPREYSASGSCSHKMLELTLLTGQDPGRWLGETWEFEGFKFEIDRERIERVRSVARAITSEPGTTMVEHRLNTSPILQVPGQQGHADVIQLDPDARVELHGTVVQGRLTVHDFKDGWLRVDAKDNLQGLIYCAAALHEVDLMAPFEAIRFTIHQPKLDHYDEYTYTRDELRQFLEVIRPAAQYAHDIYTGALPFEAARDLNPGDDQCKWCAVRGQCPARAKRIVASFGELKMRHTLDDEAFGALYAQLDEIEGACKDFRGEALKRALNGRIVAGQKLVRSKPGPRQWTDAVEAEKKLAAVWPGTDEGYYEPRKILSPTQVENVGGPEIYEIVKPLVRQQPGALTLAPLSDKRSAVQPAQFEPLKADSVSTDSLI